MYRSLAIQLSKTGSSRCWRGGAAFVLASGLLISCGDSDNVNAGEAGAEDTLQADEVATGDENTVVDRTATDTEADTGIADTDRSTSDSSEADTVRQTFSEFTQLVVASETEAALGLLNPSSLQWADDILVQTLDADETALTETLPLSAGAAVTLFRASLPTEQLLEASDGTGLLTAAADTGVLSSIVVLLPTGDVEIDGDEAFFVRGGYKQIRFERSDQGWLIDLPFAMESLLDSNEEAIMALFVEDQGPVTKAGFYNQWVSGFGKTFDDVKQPLR